MSIISGFAKGFLGLLDSQTFGEAPRELVDSISPTVDVAELYLLQKQRQVAQVVAAPANGANVLFQVPTGEVWRIHSCHSLGITGAGVTLDHQPYVTHDGAALYLADFMVQPASTWRSNVMKAHPLWVSAGDTLGVTIQNLVGVPTVAMTLLYSPIKA